MKQQLDFTYLLFISLLAVGCHSVEDIDEDLDAGGDTDSTFTTCAEASGTCTVAHWEICGANQQPYANDQKLDCGGHCCVDAPPGYSCNDDPEMNCVGGTVCPECWESAADTSLECQTGRVCCDYVCY